MSQTSSPMQHCKQRSITVNVLFLIISPCFCNDNLLRRLQCCVGDTGCVSSGLRFARPLSVTCQTQPLAIPAQWGQCRTWWSLGPRAEIRITWVVVTFTYWIWDGWGMVAGGCRLRSIDQLTGWRGGRGNLGCTRPQRARRFRESGIQSGKRW